MKDRVLRRGRPYLDSEAIEAAFPAPLEGLVHVTRIALAPDGTLVLGVYRFPPYGPPQAALEFWRGREPVGSFALPSGSLAGELAFSRDGRLVAAFGRDGGLRGIYDRRGRRVTVRPAAPAFD